MSLGVIVQDDVLGNPSKYRDLALHREFADITIGPDTFRNIQTVTPIDFYFSDFTKWLCSQEPDRERLSFFKPELIFFRKSEVGQPEPHYIHHDAMMGDWTAILYLNPEPHPGDGTVFWEHRTGAHSGDWDMEDLSQFTERFRVKAKFNRAVIFPSKWFHSRALYDNYGHGADARLIQVAFGKVV